ncbi:MAG: hypothetical protein H0T42_23285 [Deltaproteobacteria bacterium]|nr:hypothetical protein [Deltaproteobacteria bacterium]
MSSSGSETFMVSTAKTPPPAYCSSIAYWALATEPAVPSEVEALRGVELSARLGGDDFRAVGRRGDRVPA